jgi:hypothetical protein
MAISTLPITFVRFSLPDATQEFWEDFDEKIRVAVFNLTEDAVSVGLVSWDDAFKTDFPYSAYQKGEYIALQFRVDERRVPPIVKKQYMLKEIERFVQENGRQPGRDSKREISERADIVLLRRAFPIPAFCELVWNPRQGVLYAGSTTGKMLEKVGEFLENKLTLRPTAMLHTDLAKRVLQNDTEYATPLEALVNDGGGVWLGYEFLTWLWYAVDTGTLGSVVSNGKVIGAGLLDRIKLAIPEDDKEQVIVMTSDPNSVKEARIALHQGKKVSEISLSMSIGDSEYVLTLDKNVWGIKGIKPPKHDTSRTTDDESDGKFFEKMYFVEEVSDAVDALYREFMLKRLDLSNWEELKASLLEWIQRGTQL